MHRLVLGPDNQIRHTHSMCRIFLQTISVSIIVIFMEWCKFVVIIFFFFCFREWATFHVVTFNIILLFLFIAHTRAAFTDPGIVPIPKNGIDLSDIHSGQSLNGKVRVQFLSF